MTSSALTLKRHAYAARRRTSRMLINSPVSINGTAAVSHRRDVAVAQTNKDDDAPFTPSKTCTGNSSPLERPPVAHRTRTSWRTSNSSSPVSGSDSSLMETPSHRPPPLSLRPSSVDPVGSDLSSARMSSASSRSSKVSPSDIIRLADDKFDRHRAVAAAAARRRFVLMTIGKSSRPASWKNPCKNPHASAAVTSETEGHLQLSPSSASLRAVPDSVCVLSCAISVDLTSRLDDENRLPEQSLHYVTRSSVIREAVAQRTKFVQIKNYSLILC